MVQEGALPPLIALLRSPLESIQEQAAVAVRNISVNPEYDLKMVQEGGLAPLVAMLSSGNEVCACIYVYVCT
jgi:hypothetical protein